MATLAPEGTPWYALIVVPGEDGTKKRGNIRLRIYPGGIVGDERDMIRKMRIGQIHGAAFQLKVYLKLTLNTHIVSYPCYFKSMRILTVRDQIKNDLVSGAERTVLRY